MKFIGSLTIGQYVPIDSTIHSLDPRTKLLGLILFMTLLFVYPFLEIYFFYLIFLHIILYLSNISYRVIWNGLKPIMLLILLTAFFNLFFTQGEEVLWIITREGIKNSILFSLRIYLLIFSSLLLTFTTSPLRLTDSIEFFMKPLKKLKVPVEEISLMLVIALRFIPTIINEIDRLIKAQKSRGVNFEKGNIIQRIKKLIPVFIPLFISFFKRADELAEAMESRAYQGGAKRTKRVKLKFKRRDYVSFILVILLFIITHIIYIYV
ncbi:MAG: energy-coupling factor transporter transmembrane protein EcfT [Candidatus Mcinerneyibacterium aminivorans]|uniref:Energy-coupling factor transporter transmembrane protein EcfT n=1 Tax=Candidatus Mcinerneyibacterium aminivorans TaxID=2703815 RepID=A0A5D0MAI7_9BACT|nr:MAG: energy-coupling factor transporter transmembrane protein EcfT [Candidatus Mcinerneyibacterium aminivorans]